MKTKSTVRQHEMSHSKNHKATQNDPSLEIISLFVLHKLILQKRMCSHPVGLDVWFSVGPFVYFHTSWVRTAKALVRLRRPSLITCVISTIIYWTGSNKKLGPDVRLLCIITGWPLVRQKSGKFDFSSGSGKSQGILQLDQGNFKYQESQGKVREFHNFAPKYLGCSRYFFKCMKMVIFFLARFARSILLKMLILEILCRKTL